MTLSPAERAAVLMAECPGHDWRLEELANLVHLSVSQLVRAFSRRFDLSPMRFLMHLRAHLLARLLLETDLPVAEAMARVGWRSRGHAARHFKATFGVPPSRYRTSSPSVPHGEVLHHHLSQPDLQLQLELMTAQ